MNKDKKIGLFVMVALITGVILAIEFSKPKVDVPNGEVINISDPSREKIIKEKEILHERAKELIYPDGYINIEEGFNLKDVIGEKVVLIDFWTYSCINCHRTFPYLKAWYEKYKDEGLLIVGIHTPEFDFEKKYENVQKAVNQFGIEYPVIQDNNYYTWSAYKNRYWPRKYLIDIDGFIVYDYIGEGGYKNTEKKIQELLRERAERLGMETVIAEDFVSPKAQEVDFSRVKSPEVYFGAWRNEYLGNGITNKQGIQSFNEPEDIAKNVLYMVGDWNIMDRHAVNLEGGAKIIFKYESKDVYFVASSKGGVRAKVLKDGKLLTGEGRGEDVGSDGYVTIKEERLYKLIQNSNYGEHTLEIIIESPGIEVFTFTFG